MPGRISVAGVDAFTTCEKLQEAPASRLIASRVSTLAPQGSTDPYTEE